MDWRRNRSFSTLPFLGRDADVLLGRGPGRRVVDLGAPAAPLPLAEEITRASHGLAFPPRPEPERGALDEIASAAEVLAGRLASRGADPATIRQAAVLHAKLADPTHRAALAATLPRLALHLLDAGASPAAIAQELDAILSDSPELARRLQADGALADLVLDCRLASATPQRLLRRLVSTLRDPARGPARLAAVAALGPHPVAPWADWFALVSDLPDLDAWPKILARAAVDAPDEESRTTALERLEARPGFWPEPLVDLGFGGRVALRDCVIRKWLALPRGDPRRRGGVARLRRAVASLGQAGGERGEG